MAAAEPDPQPSRWDAGKGVSNEAWWFGAAAPMITPGSRVAFPAPRPSCLKSSRSKVLKVGHRRGVTCGGQGKASAPSAVGISTNLLFKCGRGVAGLQHGTGGAPLQRENLVSGARPRTQLETVSVEGCSWLGEAARVTVQSGMGRGQWGNCSGATGRWCSEGGQCLCVNEAAGLRQGGQEAGILGSGGGEGVLGTTQTTHGPPSTGKVAVL